MPPGSAGALAPNRTLQARHTGRVGISNNEDRLGQAGVALLGDGQEAGRRKRWAGVLRRDDGGDGG